MSSQAEAVKPAAAPIPFSYAQAARGGSSNTASAQSSKTPSGAITPAREQVATSALKSDLNGAKWSDSMDDDLKDTTHSSASTAIETQSTSSRKSPVAHATNQVNGMTSPSPHDLAGASPSTLVREDGSSPMSEMPESAWDTKSQGALASKSEGARARGSTDRASSKGRKKGGKKSDRKDKTDSEDAASKEAWTAPPPPPVKFVDAPAPSVNIWQIRAQQTKSPVAAKPAVTSSSVSPPVPATKASAPIPDERKPVEKLTAPSSVATPVQVKETATEKTVQGQSAEEKDFGIKSKQQTRGAAKIEPPPKVASPPVDQEAWPTPETAQGDEHRKKSQDKLEPEPQAAHAPKGKHAWEKVDFTPSVVFSTPLPGQTRRGGKSGRGGREGQSRGGATGQNERRGESNSGSSGGDSSRKERAEINRSTSPSRSKRASNDETSVRRGSRQESVTRDGSSKPFEDGKSKSVENIEQAASRQSSVLRSKANRKDYSATNGERRRDEAFSTKENDVPVEGKFSKTESSGQAPASTSHEARKQDISPAAHERKGSVATEYPPRNHERKSSGSYSSYTGRGRPERGRGGRGRGNGHSFHPGAQSFMNGQGAPFTMQGYNNMPKSPTGFGPDAFFGQAQPHGQRFGRNYPSRASSMVAESSYSRLPNGFAGQPLQINTGIQANGVYPQDYYMPATAVPYQNDTASNLIHAVATQMEYYFSVDNLLKDMYLRKHMDSQGFVLLTFIAEFKRLKSMTNDLELIKFVCQQSPNIEHRIGSDGVDRLRASKGWDNWVLPMTDRDHTAQHEGPDSVHHPPPPHPQLPDQPHLLRHSSLPVPQSAGPIMGSQGFQSLNSFAAPYAYSQATSVDPSSSSQNQAPPTNNIPSDQNAPPSTLASMGNLPVQPQFFHAPIEETEPDSFTDAEVDVLRVVVRNLEPTDTGSSSGGASHRTFSNGSVEGLNGLHIALNASGSNPATTQTDNSEKATSPTASERVNRFLSSSSRLASPRNNSRTGTTHDSVADTPGIYWIKDKDSPAHEMPPETTSDLYLAARDRALQQRNFHPCPHDMNVMYQFWEHFLVRNFNARMYVEFRTFAMEDASARNEFQGLNSLLKYYGKAISHEVPIRHSVANDYVSLVRSEPRESDRPAFKQLRAAWRDGALNMKNRKRVKDFLDKAMEEELDR